jgi:hypothetical protein
MPGLEAQAPCLADAEELLAFETRNRAWFESVISVVVLQRGEHSRRLGRGL